MTATKEQLIADAREKLSAALNYAKGKQTPLTEPYYEAIQQYLDSPSKVNQENLDERYVKMCASYNVERRSFLQANGTVSDCVFEYLQALEKEAK
jgi:hypothetical protein